MGLFKNWFNAKSDRTDDSKSETAEQVNRHVDAKEERTSCVDAPSLTC